MPAFPILTTTFPHLLNRYPHRCRPLEQMHFMLRDSIEGNNDDIIIKEGSTNEIRSGDSSGGEEKHFGDKWEPINEEKSGKVYTNHLDDSDSAQSSHLNFQDHHHHQLSHLHPATSILGDKQSHQAHHQSPPSTSQHLHPQITDEVSLDSQDIPEAPVSGSASSPCPQKSSTKENTSFLFVGPLGKKRKYSRQRATSDDNESESHPPTAAGSPDSPEEEMDQSQSPSPGESSQSSGMGRPLSRKNSPVSLDHPSSGGAEPVSTITNTPSTHQSTTSPESCGESAGESSMGGTESGSTTAGGGSVVQGAISKPAPMIGAPTSVIRRVSRKKQENPLPLNLSVSSPPENSNSNFSSSSGSSTPNLVSASPGGRVSTQVRGGDSLCPTTNPSVIREELYFDGRSAGQGDRQVFIWRYRDDVTAPSPLNAAAAGPMSPTSSTVSATSFVVPDVLGQRGDASSGMGSSSSSTVSQLHSGSHDPHQQSHDSKSQGSGASGKPLKKKLKCGDCGKEFSQLRNYRYHRSRHEGSDQFSCTCPVCGKQFNDRGYLSSHMKIHRNAKEYRCEFCSKGFNQRVAYNMHRRIHTGHRPHICEVCSKSFSRRMLLKQHMRIHTGERPYSCGVCNKAFADRSNMLLHQRLHSGERPYVCEICKKSFSKNHHLKTHMNHHAGIKPYECPKCHARFSQSSNMKTHLKKCSGVPNPTTSQRQQMLRRNPLDIGRGGGHMPSLPPLPSLPSASRLLYEQQSLSLLTQSMASGQAGIGGPSTVPQLSPGHSRGQAPIESLLLHLNVGRTRHHSQGSGHSQAPVSPPSPMPFPDLQLMLRNAAAAAAGSRSVSGSSSHGQRSIYSSPPPSSSSSSSVTVTTSGMGGIPGMSSFGGLGIGTPTSVVTSMRRNSPPHASLGGGNEPISPPSLSPIMSINPSLGLVGYGRSSSNNPGQMDSSVMPPPSSNSTVLRGLSSSQQTLIPQELLSPPTGGMLRIDTRSMDGFPTIISPPEKNNNTIGGGRQGRIVPNSISPRRKQPSPSSLTSSGSFIPLSTLESAAIANGLRSPSQMVRFLSSALRDAEGPIQQGGPSSSHTRLPSISHQNVLEAMVVAAAAEQQQSLQSASTRVRQVPSPQQTHHHQQQHQHHHHHSQVQSGSFQFSGELPSLPSLHGLQQHQEQVVVVGPPPPPPQQQQLVGTPSSPYSVITSSHLLQNQEQLNLQSGLANVRFSPSSPSPASSASRLASAGAVDTQHHPAAADQSQQIIELHHHQQHQPNPQQRQHGYHQSLLLSHVSQGTVSPSAGYSSNPSGNNNNSSSSSGSSASNYSAFTHSIIRSRSHSPGSVGHNNQRERNQEYQN